MAVLRKDAKRGRYLSRPGRRLVLHVLDERAKALELELKRSRPSWADRKVMKKELKELFKAQKAVAEQIIGKSKLKKEARKVGWRQAMKEWISIPEKEKEIEEEYERVKRELLKED